MNSRRILIVLGGIVGLAILWGGFQGLRAWSAWNSIDRVEFDLAEARKSLPSTTPSGTAQATTTTSIATAYQAVLVVGSDEQDNRPTENPDAKFADAILLYLVAESGGAPVIVSLPRDLIVVDPCTGHETKLTRTLDGCEGAVSGEQLVALAVEDFSGIAIDHYASLRFEALVAMVDTVGGVEICVPYALREGQTDLLPAGCSTVTGDQALMWLRSRQTQEFVDGEWRFVEGAGDAARIERQQVLLFSLLDALRRVRSPADLAGFASELGDTIQLSETLGIRDAVALAWELRGIDGASIRTITVPTERAALADGSFALRATMTVRELVEG